MSKDIIHFKLYSCEEYTDYDGKKHDLGGLHLMSKSFKFLLEAAFHQYEAQRLNRIYIRKNNLTKWKNSKTPNSWTFFLDFSNGKIKPPINWDIAGIIDMNKINSNIIIIKNKLPNWGSRKYINEIVSLNKCPYCRSELYRYFVKSEISILILVCKKCHIPIVGMRIDFINELGYKNEIHR